ncbi:MAG: lipid-A-disaccharide synthase [Hyphomicrobium sp. 32-62-53]|nr:MAG: lipid-A-disaccharide synthase [Hyphomicrobium sp. 12-62-95]OYX99538.1 MAG: lipid-A-disaccharide synthase [Hyphomicrobium sp. 32-62-53]
MAEGGRPLRLYLIAGEHSGDALGAKLMAEIRARLGAGVVFDGVGGEEMAAQGLVSLFPLSDVAVMGPINIAKQLPRLIDRVHQTVRDAVAVGPDVVVIIDSPEFTHPIAKRIRQRMPSVPVIDYVSPSVWAWRPGRAKKMRAYVDHVLALLPFEPDAHVRLGGPKCTYVGHSLSERLDWIRAQDGAGLSARLGLDANARVLVVLPGSRASEVTRLMAPFGETVRRVRDACPEGLEVLLPVVPSVRALVEAALKSWDVPVRFVEGEADKFAAFRLAEAALAASGTVTLELGLSGTPAVVAYKVDAVASRMRFLLKVRSVVLANLVADENIYPEFLQENATPEKMSAALTPLLTHGPERRLQVEALVRVRERIATGDKRPSALAADVVLDYATHARLRA